MDERTKKLIEEIKKKLDNLIKMTTEINKAFKK